MFVSSNLSVSAAKYGGQLWATGRSQLGNYADPWAGPSSLDADFFSGKGWEETSEFIWNLYLLVVIWVVFCLWFHDLETKHPWLNSGWEAWFLTIRHCRKMLACVCLIISKEVVDAPKHAISFNLSRSYVLLFLQWRPLVRLNTHTSTVL